MTASMQPKSDGVPKWSTPRSVTSRASGSAASSWSARPGEVPVAQHEQHWQGDRGQIGQGQRRVRRAQVARDRVPVVARGGGQPPEQARRRVVRFGAGLEPRRDARPLPAAGPGAAIADAEQRDLAEPARFRRGRGEQRLTAGREAHRVDLGVVADRGQDRRRAAGLGRVLGRVGAVPRQVHADHGAPLVGQYVDPAGRSPVVLERRRETVHEQYRVIVHAATITSPAPGGAR